MSVTILITGDFCPINRNQDFIDKRDFKSVFGEFAGISKDADLAVTNLESPLTQSTRKIDKSGPCIKARPNAGEALNYAGFGIVTLANNHIMDFGSEGLKDTLAVCRNAGIETVGADRDLIQARKPLIQTVNGKRIGILNFAENEFCTTTGNEYGANPLNPVSNYYDIAETKKNVDFLLVIVHGGREHFQLPSPRVRENFRFFADAGADAVVSHHTHCFSGYETWNGTPIFYGLGNFVFDYKKKYQKGLWTEGYAVRFTIGQNIDFEIIPYLQGRREKATVELLSEDQRIAFDKRVQLLNQTIADDQKFQNAWREYIDTQKESYKALLFVQNKYVRFLMAKNLFPKVFLQSKAHKNVVLNLFRCETHREIMIETLNKKID